MTPRRLVSCALLGALLVPLLPAAASAARGSVAPSGTPVVVELAAGTSASERAGALAAQGLRELDAAPDGSFVLAAPVEPAAGPVGVGGVVVDVEPVVTYEAFGVPNDPGYPFQWHLEAIDAAPAWDVNDGDGAVVAVIDTGVAYATANGYLRAPDMAGTSFVPGWDFVDGDAFPHDDNGHGTHVASTIAATTGNGAGVAGAAPGAAIMPLRVLDAAGVGTDWDTAQALRFAADQGADIANLSLGSDQFSSVMADAVAYARSKGVTVVAASGNESAATVSYPAALDGVIAVGAVRQDLALAGYSNRGSALDLVAPGGDMSVDQDSDGYPDGILAESFISSPSDFCFCFLQGTSMATPQVSAVAAILAARGVANPDAMEDLLVTTAHDLGAAGWDSSYGHGLVQADAAAVVALPPGATDPPDEPTPPPPTEPPTTDPVGTDPPPPGPTPVRGIEHACPPDETPAPTFGDLAGNVHAASIACVAWWEVAAGRTPDRFEPAATMTRAQLASFVARMLEVSGVALSASPADAFTDDETSVHEHRINQLAALGVVQGRGGGTYAPGATVTRAEMATFLVRAHDLVVDVPLPASPDRFTDDDTSTHEANIDKVAGAGLAAGTTATTFAPTAPVLRGQMATFIARTLDLFVDSGAVPPR